VQVSLNLGPSEKLSNGQLKGIAEDYMEKIGFGDQPLTVFKSVVT
jgi:hypothetical protein